MRCDVNCQKACGGGGDKVYRGSFERCAVSQQLPTASKTLGLKQKVSIQYDRIKIQCIQYISSSCSMM